ncbi:MAG: MipA/OmpV family protein [Nitrococcus sp.]|nr:MipA/OmpV family protein [Nitrococcus sp.]
MEKEKELPLWEVGLGVAPIVFSNYRGADQQTTYVLPLPYIIYRGNLLKVDRSGPRGVLFDTERLELNISFDVAPPVDSNDNDARAGMDDLDATVQIGPILKVQLTEEDADLPLRLNLPLRTVIATDFTHVEHVGWVLHPQMWLDLPKLHGWGTSIGVGPIFADEGYHDYYYGVSPDFATASRPAYKGKAGYSGSSVLMGTSRRFGPLWVGAFLRYDNLTGAAFEDSPLVETKHAFIAGAGIAWIFWRSEERVSAQ